MLVFSAIAAFLFVRGLDEEMALGNSAQIWVHSDDSASGVRVARTIASFAKDHEVSVAREVPDARNPDGRRHLYLAPGGDAQSDPASWLHDGYPGFSRQYDTDVHPIADIGQRDPRGFYYVFGPSESAEALVAEFTGLGLHATVQHPLSASELALRFSGDDLFRSMWVVALAIVTLVGASVLLGAKSYGVLRLQGKSFLALLTRDLRQLATFWLAAVGTVTAAVLLFLGFYNGLAWLALFASTAAILAGLLIVLALAAHAVALALTFKLEVLRALKGELPTRAAILAIYLVRIPALLLAVGIALDVALAGQNVLTRQDSQDTYAKAGDAVTIRLNGSLGGKAKPAIAHVGQWLRQADGANQIIVAGRRDLQGLPSKQPLPQGEMLIVNETFLAEQPVLDPAGQRYSPAARPGKVADAHKAWLIVPESLTGRASDIRAAVPDLFGRMAPDLRRHLKVETLSSKNGQRVFAYNSGSQSPNAAHSPDDDRSLVDDPVLVVVPNGSKILTNDAYTAFASQEGIIFPDPNNALAAIAADKNELQTYVTAVRPVGQSASLELREAVNRFRLSLFNLIAAVTALLITGIGVCYIHTRKHAQAIFAQHISGWRFARIHRFILATEMLLAALLAWWVPVQVWQQNRDLAEFTSRGVPPPFPPVQVTAADISVIAGLAVVEVCIVLCALGMFHRRIIKEGTADN
ncbi:hypothetical protein [Streptomyces sp. NPDC087300]|uniref:hypothetical protein n=1 Tax=Streptomyces sp. NPDC087300 TaxID=3365780 RepID=UPI003821081C